MPGELKALRAIQRGASAVHKACNLQWRVRRDCKCIKVHAMCGVDLIRLPSFRTGPCNMHWQPLRAIAVAVGCTY